jgi:hypothetical protein
MNRAIGACVVLIPLMAIYCLAAEPAAESKAGPQQKPSARAAANLPKPVIPERKLTFDISEEEQAVPFRTTADPTKLAEQRYVATFSLVGPIRLGVARLGAVADREIDEYRVAVNCHQLLLLRAQPPHSSLERELKLALKQMPRERVPSDEVMSQLTELLARGSSSFRRSVAPAASEQEGKDMAVFHFEILAPTPERAKELVQALLAFYDYAVFYPLQKDALAVKAAYQKRLEEDRAALKEAQSSLPALEKQLAELKEYADITPEALAQFTTQQRLISVDMQGVKARIDACNKILAGVPRPSRRSEQLETLKITAEIELVGLAARKEALEKIVEKGQERKELSGKRAQTHSRARSLEVEISMMLDGIRDYEAELKKCMPYPVEGAKVVIRRIKWVPPGQ